MDNYNSREVHFILRLLSIFVFIGFLGAVKPVIFNGGSSLAKYFAKQKQLELVQEENVEKYMESALFGDGEKTLEFANESIPEEERTELVEVIFKFDFYIAILLVLGSIFLLFPQTLFKYSFYHFLIPISLWLLSNSIAVSLNGGKAYSELAVLAHSTRWGMPLVLWFGLYFTRRGGPIFERKVILYIAAICTSFTFAVHGWEALNLNPSFQDLLYSFSALLSWDMSGSINSGILKFVGCMDIFLALFLLYKRSPKLLLWMACWGIITALSRPLALGIEAWPEMAMRIANCFLPFFLYQIYHNQKKLQANAELDQYQNSEMIYE